MAEERPSEISKETKNLHTARKVKGFLPT